MGKPAPDSQGTLYSVPGRYRIIAIHDPDITIPEETGMLEKLRRFATPVTLVADKPAKISISVANVVR